KSKDRSTSRGDCSPALFRFASISPYSVAFGRQQTYEAADSSYKWKVAKNIRGWRLAMLRFSILALALAGFTVSEAAGLGRDFSKEELEANGQLVKGQKPVHGYWINWDDTYFYSGDTAALNQFLVAYGKLQHFKLKVVIHSGAKTAPSLGDRT